MKTSRRDIEGSVSRGGRSVLHGLLVFALLCGAIVAISRGGPGASTAAPQSPPEQKQQADKSAADDKLNGMPPEVQRLVRRVLDRMASTRRAVAALKFCRNYTRVQQSLQDAQASLDEMIAKLRKSDKPQQGSRRQ